MLDRVYMQFVTFMDDPIYRDQHEVNIELIRTLARVGPNAEPRFRDDCEYSFFYFHIGKQVKCIHNAKRMYIEIQSI